MDAGADVKAALAVGVDVDAIVTQSPKSSNLFERSKL